jgi:hypothetical protein
MAVEVNSTRKAVEISWDDMGGSIEEPPVEEKPPGYPAHPIAPGGETPTHPIAPGGEAPDQGLPGDQPRPDQGLPGEQPYPDQGLPGDQPRPDQGLPPSGVGPSHPIFLPPYVDNSLPGEARRRLREFLTGNLPPSAQPTGGKQIAVQIFAQGQEGDWSNTPVMPNDGLAVLTFPKDFKGESYVEVRALDGALIDSGTITVK